MRYLALDLGNRRIGLAAGGDAGVPVVPAGYLERRTLRHDLDGVLAAAQERNAGAIVVGMPYSLSGETGPQARLAQALCGNCASVRICRCMSLTSGIRRWKPRDC